MGTLTAGLPARFQWLVKLIAGVDAPMDAGAPRSHNRGVGGGSVGVTGVSSTSRRVNSRAMSAAIRDESRKAQRSTLSGMLRPTAAAWRERRSMRPGSSRRSTSSSTPRWNCTRYASGCGRQRTVPRSTACPSEARIDAAFSTAAATSGSGVIQGREQPSVQPTRRRSSSTGRGDAVGSAMMPSNNSTSSTVRPIGP